MSPDVMRFQVVSGAVVGDGVAVDAFATALATTHSHAHRMGMRQMRPQQTGSQQTGPRP